MVEENKKQNVGMIKNFELIVLVIALPHILQITGLLSPKFADSLGVFIACIITYFVPPRSNISLKQYFFSGLFSAIFVFIFITN